MPSPHPGAGAHHDSRPGPVRSPSHAAGGHRSSVANDKAPGSSPGAALFTSTPHPQATPEPHRGAPGSSAAVCYTGGVAALWGTPGVFGRHRAPGGNTSAGAAAATRRRHLLPLVILPLYPSLVRGPDDACLVVHGGPPTAAWGRRSATLGTNAPRASAAPPWALLLPRRPPCESTSSACPTACSWPRWCTSPAAGPFTSRRSTARAGKPGYRRTPGRSGAMGTSSIDQPTVAKRCRGTGQRRGVFMDHAGSQ